MLSKLTIKRLVKGLFPNRSLKYEVRTGTSLADAEWI